MSAHLLAATPTGHWLEYVDWADAIVAEPLRIVDGYAIAPDRPGNGLVWDAKAVERYRMLTYGAVVGWAKGAMLACLRGQNRRAP